jgi:spermidine synthase
MSDETYLLEALTPGFGHYIKADRLLHTGQSPFQKIELFDSPDFGKTLRLDGVFQTSEKDEFYYHEMMVHPALLSHPNPERVLIIGAGDGGMAEEVLKHNTVKQVVMVELDEQVVRLSRKHLQSIHRGSFDDDRLTLHIGDGYAYVMDAAKRGERFDVVILDLTDPIGPSRPLYTVEYYRTIADLLGKTGIQVQHIETPIIRQTLYRQLVANLEAAYAEVHPLFQYVPLYGALWSFCNSSQTLNPRHHTADELDARVIERGLTDLSYYNGDTHLAAYAQPNYVRALLAQPAQPIHLDQIDRFDDITALGENVDALRIIRD